MSNLSRKAYKERFIDILVDSFAGNPAVNDVVKQDSKADQRLRKLAAYSYNFGERRQGNYLSSDENGVAISYVEDMNRTLSDHWASFNLILQVSGVQKAKYLLQKEAYRASVRPKEPFYYVWFIGVDASYRGGECGKELKRHIFSESARLCLPILQETTIPKNKKVYEYFGFRTYHVHQFHESLPPTHFMRREVSQNQLIRANS